MGTAAYSGSYAGSAASPGSSEEVAEIVVNGPRGIRAFEEYVPSSLGQIYLSEQTLRADIARNGQRPGDANLLNQIADARDYFLSRDAIGTALADRLTFDVVAAGIQPLDIAKAGYRVAVNGEYTLENGLTLAGVFAGPASKVIGKGVGAVAGRVISSGIVKSAPLALVRANQLAGASREALVRSELAAQYPGSTLVNEAYLRTADGVRALDPLTGTARRIDSVVVQDGRAVASVEVTSMTATKRAQILKEMRIRNNGGSFIRDRATGQLIDISGVPTQIIRKP